MTSAMQRAFAGAQSALRRSYGQPVTYQRGTPLEFSARPADVVKSLAGAAAARGMLPQDVALATTANAVRLFGLSI